MDHIRNIQETIDENREAIPTGVVAEVMRECQQAYKTLPKLWKVHYVEVYAVRKNSVESTARALIVEEDANLLTKYKDWSWCQVLDHCMIPPADQHVDIKGGHVVNEEGRVRVILKVEPFPKLAREE